MSDPTTDASAAQRFLDVLAPGERVTFQTFDDTGAKRKGLNRVLHGSLAERVATLSEVNAHGAAVCWMVNADDGKGRKMQNVRRVRALFVDLDGAPLEPVEAAPLPPHCIVETSPSRWHAYWRVSDCPLTEFTPLQKALASRFAADNKVTDVNRVMRLPGFDHCKQRRFRTRCVVLHETPPYTLAQLREEFALDKVVALPAATDTACTRKQLPARISEGERNDTLFNLACGFVRKGFYADAVNQRLQRINAERCDPQLCASEVDTIVANAMAYGSDGFAMLPHKLLDSLEWKALAPAAHDVILMAFRRHNGTDAGVALTWGDFAGRPGFANKQTFYRHRAAAVRSGILVQTKQGRNAKNGHTPDLFAIAPRWLREVFAGVEIETWPRVRNLQPLHR